jgi:hypothetical protein
MSPQEVVWFINHKFGEQAYLVEDNDKIVILSLKSKWIIFKKDFARFHTYTLFHFNDVEREHYHVQNKSQNIDYLVYIALMHDNGGKYSAWKQFCESWELFKLGREIESRAAAWNFITSDI